MSIQFPVLYHQSRKGKIHSWKIWTEGNEICTERGQVDGKKTLDRKPVRGKNLGKANETTPETQAQAEAASKHKNKLDRKYSKTIEEAKDPVFLPMLANSWEKCKKKVEYPVDVQRKLDGVRCMAFWHGDEVKLLSRGGKEYKVAHLSEELAGFLPEGMVLDGEIYIHGTPLNMINRLVKKPRPGPEGSAQLEYHVYDCFYMGETDVPWSDRRHEIYNRLGMQDTGKVVGCLHWEANNEEEIHNLQAKFIQEGYEGAIVRCLDGDYNLGHRSRKLLKVKSFIDDEFRVVGFTQATGTHEGCVIWTCVTKELQEFNVTPRGTLDERRELYKVGDKYKGRLLTVRYAWENEGVPQQPIGIAFRLEEDLP